MKKIKIASDATVSNFVFTGVTGWITSAPALVLCVLYSQWRVRLGHCCGGLKW